MSDQGCWAKVRQWAAFAQRLASGTDGSPVKDQQMREIKPVRLGYDTHQLYLDLYGIVVAGPAKAACQAHIMGVDGKAFQDRKSTRLNSSHH